MSDYKDVYKKGLTNAYDIWHTWLMKILKEAEDQREVKRESGGCCNRIR